MGMRSAVQVFSLAALCVLGPACGGGGSGGGGGGDSPGPAGPLVLLRDIQTRQASAAARSLCVAGGIVFFVATEWQHGEELWKTDGTPAGTGLVKDLRPGSLGSSPELLTAVGSMVFFEAVADPATGWQLWRSDGSDAGTIQLTSLGTNFPPQHLTAVGSTLFFTAYDPVNGNALWRSDGTPGGTLVVSQIRSGGAPSQPDHLIAVNLAGLGATLFFTVDDGSNGNELWMSDGTTLGTKMVAQIQPGSGSSYCHLIPASKAHMRLLVLSPFVS